MRKPRFLVPGARYHVTSRINHQEMRLDDQKAKELFLAVVKRAKAKYAFKIENFTLMGNHFHLIIKPENSSNLSKIMQWILGVFSMAYNKIHCLKGHLWQERFFSRVLSSLEDWLKIFRYIDENPVAAGLVEHTWEWPYGGLSHRRLGNTDIVDILENEFLIILTRSLRPIGD